MRLNSLIILEYLQKQYPITVYGRAIRELTLLPPELFVENSDTLKANHVYVATAEQLPQRPQIEENVLLICIGQTPRLLYYKEHATVMEIKRKADFFGVYRQLQDCFRLYQDWESQLLQLILNTPSVQDVLDCAYPLFHAPMYVLNESLQYLAATHPEVQSPMQGIGSALGPEAFLQFLQQSEPIMDRRGAFALELPGMNCLCVNLFDGKEQYTGCLYILRQPTQTQHGDEAIAEYLANVLVRVLEMFPALHNSRHALLRDILKTVLNQRPLSQKQKLLLKSVNYKQRYTCVSVHDLNQFSTLPVDYICSVFEAMLPDSLFFEQGSSLLGLIPSVCFQQQSSERSPFLGFMDAMQLRVGISNEVTDLYLLRTYYYQAEAAIENGQLYEPGQNLNYFSRFALYEMIASSMGNSSVEAFYPDGFAQLLAHDQTGGVSYLETLTVFLEENMSYTQAARRLYIHRSSLVERMENIQRELQVDLQDPDQRLQLQMILKAMQMENQLKKQ